MLTSATITPQQPRQRTELAAYKGNRDDEEVSGRLELDYNINDDLMVYGSWNLGVRGGGYNAPIFP